MRPGCYYYQQLATLTSFFGIMPRWNAKKSISRRDLLKALGCAPLLLRSAPIFGLIGPHGGDREVSLAPGTFPFSDVRLTAHYPTKSPLSDVIQMIQPGLDEYRTEAYAAEISVILDRWSVALKAGSAISQILEQSLRTSMAAGSFIPYKQTSLRKSFGITVVCRSYPTELVRDRARFLREFETWLTSFCRIETAEFEVFSIQENTGSPTQVSVQIRYALVGNRVDQSREERVGCWSIDWSRSGSEDWLVERWTAGDETACTASGKGFTDVTPQALGEMPAYHDQFLRGSDHWRTALDGAVGVDVYGNNGIAAGDFDGDGFDDLYICQPSGIPNRLLRNRGDGTFEDVTEHAGVGVLDNTACALFADFLNRGRQDLLVVCATGPVLFLNQGDGTFALKRQAFNFSKPAQGTFTHAAIADYDRDGRLDIYFCTYMYYLGLDQYHYPIPYYDARNGPPNCLFHNEGDGTFVETTELAGLNADNDRYSFACAWGDANSDGLPDLFVANDFGSSQLYRNNGDGTFKVVSRQAGVESVGAGMGCCWCDYDNDGHQDVYVPSMWEAAGQRVSGQSQFHQDASQKIRELYQRHARGNALYRNSGDAVFENVGQEANVEMGRWSWSSDFFDFDHDGFSDLYVANGYISGPVRNDLAGFFWRQVVAKSSEDATPSLAYERGWNAINELIRSDSTWHGFARNVLFLNNGNGTFSEASGPTGLDFLEDSRAFALADIDHDGRLEVVLKNRNAPQVRILHNDMREIGASICFHLRGTKSNRDAIGAAITVETKGKRQTKYLQAGSGFLSQHSKSMFFGLGDASEPVRAQIHWPSGLSQSFENIPLNHRIAIEEGRTDFSAELFSSSPKAYSQAQSFPHVEPLPEQTATWLVQPVKSPGVSLPDLNGVTHDLDRLRGTPVLLIFWSTISHYSLEVLRGLQKGEGTRLASTVHIVAICVDDATSAQKARDAALKEQFTFPVLFSTEAVAGVYNILYRHLFDRRRDLAIPTSFLLDRNGLIVRVYQGAIDATVLKSDLENIPATEAARLRMALPFDGLLVQDKFTRNDFTLGVAMFQHGYLEEAAESFRQVIATKPDNADAYYNLGTLSLRRHDLEQAQEYLERAIQHQPDYPEAWNNLGMIAAEQGKYDEAVRNLQRSIQLRPKYSTALLNLGNVYRRQKLFDQADEALTRARALLPDDPEINYSLGMLYAQRNELQSAMEYLQRAVSLKRDYPEALNNLGIIFVRQQDYPKAEEQFKTGIRVSPNFDQSYLNLARLYAITNEKDRARQVLADLLRIQPQNAVAKQALEMLR